MNIHITLTKEASCPSFHWHVHILLRIKNTYVYKFQCTIRKHRHIRREEGIWKLRTSFSVESPTWTWWKALLTCICTYSYMENMVAAFFSVSRSCFDFWLFGNFWELFKQWFLFTKISEYEVILVHSYVFALENVFFLALSHF